MTVVQLSSQIRTLQGEEKAKDKAKVKTLAVKTDSADGEASLGCSSG